MKANHQTIQMIQFSGSTQWGKELTATALIELSKASREKLPSYQEKVQERITSSKYKRNPLLNFNLWGNPKKVYNKNVYCKEKL